MWVYSIFPPSVSLVGLLTKKIYYWTEKIDTHTHTTNTHTHTNTPTHTQTHKDIQRQTLILSPYRI